MKDPRPLLDGDLPDDVASLLRAADEDVQPNAAAHGALLVARLGKGAVATAAPSMAMTTAQRFGSLRRLFAYGSVIAVAGAMVTFGWHFHDSSTASEPRANTRSSSVPMPITPLETPETAVPAPVAANPVNPPPSVDAPHSLAALPSVDVGSLPTSTAAPQSASSHNTGARKSAPGANLDDELARIDRARALLAAGKPSDVLAQITAYRREYPTAAFVDEADSLEVRAMAAQGRGAEARVLAERFLSKRPHSPYAEPVRAAAGITQ